MTADAERPEDRAPQSPDEPKPAAGTESQGSGETPSDNELTVAASVSGLPSRLEAGQPTSPTDLVGRTLGDFRVLRLLGRGGMGEVYLAEQISLRRSVALKVLKPELAQDDDYVRRFEVEAKAVAPIIHPNIVSVILIGQTDGIRYIVMEYVAGRNLREYLARKGALDVPVAVNVIRRVAAALARAAEEGIIHRDIKPENVLLTRKGEVKVADFGLARQVAEDVSLTRSGVTLGTPLYMSPEQLQGKPVDHRSDLYSLGIMGYHLLAGEPPYNGETALAVAMQHLRGQPKPLSHYRGDVPEELERIVLKLMARQRDQRYDSAREAVRELTRLRQRLESTQPLDATVPPLPTDGVTKVDTPPGSAAATERTSSSWARLRTGARLATSRARPAKRWAVLLTLGLAFVAGVLFGVAGREPRYLTRPPVEGDIPPALRPLVDQVPQQQSGGSQLISALSLPAGERQEAALWAVLENHPGDWGSCVPAAWELFHDYLLRRDYERARRLASLLASRDDTEQQLFASLMRGILLSRVGKAEESNQEFASLADSTTKLRLDPDQVIWLAEQYLLSLRRNRARLTGDAEDGSVEPPGALLAVFREHVEPRR